MQHCHCKIKPNSAQINQDFFVDHARLLNVDLFFLEKLLNIAQAVGLRVANRVQPKVSESSGNHVFGLELNNGSQALSLLTLDGALVSSLVTLCFLL